MNKTVLYTLLFLFCLLGGWILFSEPEGLVVKMKINKNDKSFHNIYYLKKEKFKLVTNQYSIIFSGNKISLIDKKQKKYWKGSRKEFNRLVVNQIVDTDYYTGGKNGYFRKIFIQKASQPSHRVVEEVAGRYTDNPQRMSITTTPNFKSIAGYACRKFQIRQNDTIVEEVWIAENLKNYINYDLNLDLYTNYMESLLQHTESKLYFHYETFMELIENGFPMKIAMFMGDKVTETEVERLIKMRLDDELFNLPSGFERVELNQLLY